MEKIDQHYEKMTKTPVSKLIIALGIPTTISMLITNIYNLADTYFVGTLGESQQGATTILFTLQAIIQAFSFMFGHGSGVFVSKKLADKDVKAASEYVSTAFFSGAIFGLLLSVFGLMFLEPFMLLLGSTDTILPYAKDYGMWVLLSCPFMVCSIVLNNNLRYEGKAFYSMIGLTTGGLLNIFGDYMLISRAGMGVYGAGLSTAVSQFISFAILLVLYIKQAQSKILPQYISRKLVTYINIVRCGLPSLIRQGLTSISNGLLNNLTKPFGDAAIAAIGVVNRFSAFVMCIGLGIGQGFQPVCAFNYEAKEYKRVKKGLLFTTAFGFFIVLIISVLGYIFASNIIYIFQKSERVIEIGTKALKYATIGLLFLPFSVPVNMLFQSIQKSTIASLLSTLRSGAVLIPALLILSSALGLQGILLSQPISDMIAGLVSIPFVIHFIKTDHVNK